MRIFLVICLVFIVYSFSWAADEQKTVGDNAKNHQDASLLWKKSELIGYTYRCVKEKSDIRYTFSDQKVAVAITIIPKPGSFICPLVVLNWAIDNKGILNMDGAPDFKKWTESWIKLEEHDDKIVVVKENGEKLTYTKLKN